jgi:hypothetical protein
LNWSNALPHWRIAIMPTIRSRSDSLEQHTPPVPDLTGFCDLAMRMRPEQRRELRLLLGDFIAGRLTGREAAARAQVLLADLDGWQEFSTVLWGA